MYSKTRAYWRNRTFSSAENLMNRLFTAKKTYLSLDRRRRSLNLPGPPLRVGVGRRRGIISAVYLLHRRFFFVMEIFLVLCHFQFGAPIRLEKFELQTVQALLERGPKSPLACHVRYQFLSHFKLFSSISSCSRGIP